MRLGVLALQGDFEAHRRAFEELGAETAEIRTAAQLEQVDGLVIPGGESTTMLKIIHLESLWQPLLAFGASRPVFGTCAGAILVASEVLHPAQESLHFMDITVERNAYGRQVHSQVTKVPYEGEPLEAVFIRAPIIRRAGPSARVLAEYGGDPVLVEQGHHLVATFHPELTTDRRVQKLFLEKVRG